jgi:hypothetical protein
MRMAQIYFREHSKRAGRRWISLGGALSLLLMAVVTVLVSEALYQWEKYDGMQAAVTSCRDGDSERGYCGP